MCAMLKWTLLTIAGLAATVALAAVAGLFLPKGHRASRTVVHAAPPAAVYAVITDVAKFPEWRSDVTSVEVLGGPPGSGRFREHGKDGPIAYRVEAREENSRLVTRIDDPSLPFGGTWTFELRPVPEGTALTITEDGEIHNPLFRVMSKLFFSPYDTIDRYHASLAARLQALRPGGSS